MKSVFLGAALTALLAGAAFADDQFAGIYGNTVTVTQPDGKVVSVYVNPDKTWEQHAADGKVMRGTYEWKDATHVCFTVTDPKPAKPEECHPQEVTGNHKAGDTWTEDDGQGHTTTISIAAGRS